MKKKLAPKTVNLSEKITTWVGSTPSLIVHTLLFGLSFVLIILGFKTDKVLLVLTTIVSLEAIYLSIFIQMTVNRNTASLQDVEEDIDEIQEDVKEISEDIDEISEDVEEVQKDVEEISEDVEEVQKDVEEISEDVEEIQKVKSPEDTIEHMQKMLEKIANDLEVLRNQENKKIRK